MERRYPVPWRQVAALAPFIRRRQGAPVDRLCAEIAARINPPPLIHDAALLPASPRFLLVANHYQRRGLWIVHPASVLTDTLRTHYGLPNPPIRWVVTANWPRWRLGPWTIPSPGDRLLPRVAAALGSYSVPFAGADPRTAARELRRLLRDALSVDRPVGLFPEGAAAVAGPPGPPLPGAGRLIRLLAKTRLPAVPVAIWESGRESAASHLEFRFGMCVSPGPLLAAADPARLLMDRIRELLPPGFQDRGAGPGDR